MARRMKDSGIEWIGEIPESWETVRFKFLHNGMNTGEAIDKEHWTDAESDTVFYTAGLVPIRTSYKQFPVWKYTDRGDLLLARNGTPYVYYPTEGACYTDHIIRAKMKDTINRKYVQYSLQQSILSVVVDAVSIATWSASLWNEQAVPMPSIVEQHRIASYLDIQCAKIDAVLEQTRQSIEEYKKLKQAVITQAVTKGIRPGRKMKDSGIEWIGEVPEEWNINTVFQFFTQVKNKNENLQEQNLLSLSYGRIIRKSINTTEGLLPASFDGYNIIEKDDIVLRLTDLQNDQRSLRVGIATERGIITSAYITLRNRGQSLPKYLYYYLHSFDIAKGFYSMGGGVRQGLTWDGVKWIKILTPSIEEQKQIVDYCDTRVERIDYLIKKKEAFFSELESYKKSLIYEIVTGKRTVYEKQVTCTVSFFDLRILLMCRIIELMKPKGRVQLQKGMYCADTLLNLNPETQYIRQKHGPYDPQIEKYEDLLVQKGWIQVKKGNPVEYKISKKIELFRSDYLRHYGKIDEQLKAICSYLSRGKGRTSRSERVATLLAVWNDLLIDGASPTDTQIVHETMTNWTPNKANIPESTWLGTLESMKENHFIPKGFGKHTVHMANQIRGK